MKTLHIWAMGLFALAIHCTGTTVRERLYTQVFDTLNGIGITSTDRSSSVDCGLLCVQSPLCRRFSYNVRDKKCWLSPNKLRLDTTGEIVHGRQCPTSKGFVIHQIGNRTRCLKHYQRYEPHDTALAECTSQDSHLFLLESTDDLNYLAGKLGIIVSWIDGGSNGMTWYGEPLPWSPWGPGYPVASQCVYGYAFFNVFETRACTENMFYVCQIDV